MKNFNLASNFQSRLKISRSLEIFNPDLQNSPQKIGVWWVARLKFSISLENFKILKFFKIWALRVSRNIAIVSLRYPLSRDTFSAIPAIPQQGAIPTLGAFLYTDISVQYPILQHIAGYVCDTPGKQARKSFAILSLKVSRDMRSIGAGPLRVNYLFWPGEFYDNCAANFPDPATLVFFWKKKARESTKKARVFSLRGTPNIPGKKGRRTKKGQGKSENNKKNKEI